MAVQEKEISTYEDSYFRHKVVRDLHRNILKIVKDPRNKIKHLN